MKSALITLATLTLANANIAFDPSKAKCDTANADLVPKENDCLMSIQDWASEHGDTGKLGSGEWHPLTCSEQCKVAVMPDEDGSVLKGGMVEDAVQNVMNKCFLDGSANRSKPFKGQVSDEGWTVSVYKGGDC